MSASFHSSRRIGLGTQIQPEALITASQSVDYNSRSQSPRGEEADEPQRIALAAKLLAILNDIATHDAIFRKPEDKGRYTPVGKYILSLCQ